MLDFHMVNDLNTGMHPPVANVESIADLYRCMVVDKQVGIVRRLIGALGPRAKVDFQMCTERSPVALLGSIPYAENHGARTLC